MKNTTTRKNEGLGGRTIMGLVDGLTDLVGRVGLEDVYCTSRSISSLLVIFLHNFDWWFARFPYMTFVFFFNSCLPLFSGSAWSIPWRGDCPLPRHFCRHNVPRGSPFARIALQHSPASCRAVECAAERMLSGVGHQSGNNVWGQQPRNSS